MARTSHLDPESGGTELWSVWELMGSSDGRTRGRMAAAAVATTWPGWELAGLFATVGSSGPWPHTTALWRTDRAQALTDALAADLGGDGLDEEAFVGGSSTLAQTVQGAFDATLGAWLIEHVRAASPTALSELAHLTGADLVLAEVFAPNQGIVLWGAADMAALAAREESGIGSGGRPGVTSATGWWLVTNPARSIV